MTALTTLDNSTPLKRLQAYAESLGVQLHIWEYSTRIVLDRIRVPREAQGRGLGTRIMKMLLEYADSAQKLVSLTPGSIRDTESGAPSQAALVRWYKKLGFIKNAGRNRDFSFRDTMYRLPQKKT